MIKRLASIFVFLSVAASVLAQGEPRASAESEVRDALAKFVYAFDDLDWDAFRLAFDDNATVFYPRAFPDRADGRAEFEKTFRVVFQKILSGKMAAPYMDIQPRDMKAQMFGRLRDCNFSSRETLNKVSLSTGI